MRRDRWAGRRNSGELNQRVFLEKQRKCPPETNKSPLKIGHPKRKLIFQPSIFRCPNVSFREGKCHKVATSTGELRDFSEAPTV